jgi:hypothetical protein
MAGRILARPQGGDLVFQLDEGLLEVEDGHASDRG